MVGAEGPTVVVRNTLRTHRIQPAEVVAVETLGYEPPRSEVHRVRKFSPAFALLLPVLLLAVYVGFDVPDLGPRTGLYVRTARRRYFVSAAEGMSEAEQGEAAAHLRARLALTTAR